MKKLLKTLALTLALALCFAMPTFAADISANNGTTSVTVQGTYVAGSTAQEVISVDVSWGAMSFTYKGANQGEWNAEKHQYENATSGSWTCETDANKITVTNHSNTVVEAQLAFAKATNTNIEGTFTETVGTANDGIMEIASAVGTAYAEAPSAVAHFNVTAGSITVNGELGTITLTIINK